MANIATKSVLRVGIAWGDKLLKEVSFSGNHGDLSCLQPFWNPEPGTKGEGMAFTRRGPQEWSLTTTGETLNKLRLVHDGQPISIAQTLDKPTAIPLPIGTWGTISQGTLSLFFQVQPSKKLPRFSFFRADNGPFVAAVTASAFMALVLIIVSAFAWEPTPRGQRKAQAPRTLTIVADVTPPKDLEILEIREEVVEPEREERLKFGKVEEPKQILQAVTPKQNKPVRPANVVMTEGGGENWTQEATDQGGFEMPGSGGARAGVAKIPLPQPEEKPPAPKIDVAKLTRDYLQMIRQELGIRKVYPLAAQRMGVAGTVSLTFVVMPDGAFSDVRIKRSSGNEMLDQAALQTVAALSGKIRRPQQIGPTPLKTNVVLRYELG